MANMPSDDFKKFVCTAHGKIDARVKALHAEQQLVNTFIDRAAELSENLFMFIVDVHSSRVPAAKKEELLQIVLDHVVDFAPRVSELASVSVPGPLAPTPSHEGLTDVSDMNEILNRRLQYHKEQGTYTPPKLQLEPPMLTPLMKLSPSEQEVLTKKIFAKARENAKMEKLLVPDLDVDAFTCQEANRLLNIWMGANGKK